MHGRRADLMFEFMLSWRSEHIVHLEELGQVILVRRLVYHDVASFVVRVPVLDHVGARMNSRVSIDAQVVDEEEHQALVVEEVLEALERELVQVVVDADDLDLDQRVVLEQLEHELGVDEAAQVED